MAGCVVLLCLLAMSECSSTAADSTMCGRIRDWAGWHWTHVRCYELRGKGAPGAGGRPWALRSTQTRQRLVSVRRLLYARRAQAMGLCKPVCCNCPLLFWIALRPIDAVSCAFRHSNTSINQDLLSNTLHVRNSSIPVRD